MSISYIALGSNLGDSVNIIKQAILAISEIPKTYVLRQTKLITTKPLYGLQQPDYINAIIKIETQLLPLHLLDSLLNIENTFGRKREEKFAARTLDLDILLYGNIKFKHPRLIIPHPRMFHREFILQLLKEIYKGNLNELTRKFALAETSKTS